MTDLKIIPKEISKLDKWLVDNRACKNSLKWINDNKQNLQRVSSNEKENYVLFALSDFVSGNTEKLRWANWVLVKELQEDELKLYFQFLSNQIPKDFYNDSLTTNIQSILEKKDLGLSNGLISDVINSNIRKDPTINTDIIIRKIIEYGINLLKKRK